jgi:predicted RNA-binding protein with PUA domain
MTVNFPSKFVEIPGPDDSSPYLVNLDLVLYLRYDKNRKTLYISQGTEGVECLMSLCGKEYKRVYDNLVQLLKPTVV